MHYRILVSLMVKMLHIRCYCFALAHNFANCGPIFGILSP